jgi:hypothetical protein
MHQAVAAQDGVASRQGIVREIGETVIAAGTISTPTYCTPGFAAFIQPASPQGASSSELTCSLANSRGSSARSTAVASISEPRPETDSAAPHRLLS